MKQSLIILGFLFIASLLPLYLLQRWLVKTLNPKQSLGRLGLLILIMLCAVMALSFLLVWSVTQVFQRP
ncbi:MAG: hypothetical protein ACK4E0_02480 [Chitinophagaceae bacterium]